MAPAPSASSQHPLDGSQDPCCRPELEEGRKGRDRQEGRCLHPFPQKHVLHREKQCHTGPAAGGEGEGRALDMGLATLLPGGRRPLVLLRPGFLCDLSSAAASHVPALTSVLPTPFPKPKSAQAPAGLGRGTSQLCDPGQVT